MTGVRETSRRETTAAIMRAAREQLASGEGNVSLRAIAREIGMVSSAVYRYFPSRDELLTALIIESYDRLGDAVEVAEGAVRRPQLRARWRASAHAIRDWAVAHPNEHALLFGTPLAGYAAPQDTIAAAVRYTMPLINLLSDLNRAGITHDRVMSTALRRELRALSAQLDTPVEPATLAAGLSAWTSVLGAVSLELFGHLRNVVNGPGVWFDAVVEQHGDLLFRT
jgi:AcrR family transcriptional regulator